MPLELAKPHLDIGHTGTLREATQAFWQQTVGLAFDQTLKLGGGFQQHRFLTHGDPRGSIVKFNHSRGGLEAAWPSGLRELLIARDGLDVPRPLIGPGSLRVGLVPSGHLGIEAVGIRLAANDPQAAADFYQRALGFERLDGERLRCGRSLLLLERAADRIEASHMRGYGYRYLTLQVTDCDAAHAHALANGAGEGRPPSTLGTTARVSFVRDPDGTWIELSERASLTGKALAPGSDRGVFQH